MPTDPEAASVLIAFLDFVTVMGLIAVIMLATIWVAYPAIIGLLASARQPHHFGEPTADATVTVVVATRESADVIRARVANLRNTSFAPDRLGIVVALDARDAKAAPEELADLGNDVQVVLGDAPGGKACAMNAGMRAASGEFIVFADSYQEFTRDTIPRLVGALQTRNTAAVSGRLILAPAEESVSPIHMYWAYETWLRGCEARWHSCIGVFGPVNALRANLWVPLPPALILDDVHTPMRLVLAGHRIGFVHNALAIDVRTSSPESEYRRKVRTLTGNIQLCAWLPDVLNPLRNPIWPQFVCHKLGRLLTPYLGTVAAVSGLILTVDELARMPIAAPVLVILLSLAILSSTELRQGLSQLSAWIVGMQAAVVMATVNGFRGRWNVWSR